MRSSRLLATTLVLAAAAVATVVSCSTAARNPTSGDAPVHSIDAPASHIIDAPGGLIDAALHDGQLVIDGPSGSPSDLGKLCNGLPSGDPTMCTTLDPMCVGLVTTNHFCTEGCGSATVAMPPAGGDAICAMQLPNSGNGRVGCLLHGGGSGSDIVLWACAIQCGGALGTCPNGMTCVNSFCE